MCGIYVFLTCSGAKQPIKPENEAYLKNLVERRGPDFRCKHGCQLTTSVWAQIYGCVLHMRGPCPVKQPIQDELDGSFLLWNGEVFDGLKITEQENDTFALFQLLQSCQSPIGVFSAMEKIQGPWAFIYWQATTSHLWFGRDIFGRRSLLCSSSDQNHSFRLSSVASRPFDSNSENWIEVPAEGIFCMDFSTDSTMKLSLYPWNAQDALEMALPLDRRLSVADFPFSQAPIFLSFNASIPEAADLSIYRLANDLEMLVEIIDRNSTLKFALDTFEQLLSDSVKTRLINQVRPCQNCIKTLIQSGDLEKEEQLDLSNECSHAKVGILFSGGLDSTVLCVLADRFLPPDEPIDLLNVAFQQKTLCKNDKTYQVPDRVSGLEALQELQFLSATRKWNFIEINVSKEEMDIVSEDRIADLVYPLNTVLDNDIGCALWFAARGQGTITNEDSVKTNYISPSRVVLTGMGADEQLAGYSRHRVCYQKNGWKGLIDELRMEMRRISYRNLGRDDRVISDHGREARFPFLDENVVHFINQLPIWYKTNLDFPKGVGDKMLLRALAYKLGLRKAATLPKRAIQFGSRISKLENSRKGTDICIKLESRQNCEAHEA